MLLWTIQNLKAYEKMCDTGKLIADTNYSPADESFTNAYTWMTKRIGAAPNGIIFPVWI